jgi:hypothetical protein
MRLGFALGIASLASLLASSVATAQTITFTKVADTETPVPAGAGTFEGFGHPSISGDEVVFEGVSQGLASGIYIDDGTGLQVVADTTTPVPGSTDSFFLVENPSVSNGNVAFEAFLGTGNVPSGAGIYIDDGVTLDVVADTTTPIPGGTGTFVGFPFGGPSISGGNIVFIGGSEAAPGSTSMTGIYIDDGATLDAVADTTTPVPGGTGTFNLFVGADVSDGKVAFRASAEGSSGIYIDDGVTLDVVADTSTAVPGGTGTFDSFGSPSIDGAMVAFKGGFPGSGIYIGDGVTLDVVADTTTQVPGGTGNFDGFLSGIVPSISGGDVAFEGLSEGSSTNGIYLHTGGRLLKVIAEGDELDGKGVTSVGMNADSLSGNRLAFRADFGPPEGIFVATVPEPHAALAGILSIAAVGLVARLRRST